MVATSLKINLRAVPRCQQHDALEIFPVVGLAPGLYADVTVDATIAPAGKFSEADWIARTTSSKDGLRRRRSIPIR